jgi:NitT/TauT family transport system ATP-binding protein
VAGLEEPSGGLMLLDGQAINGPGPDRGMVFQSYTLFPWLTVLKNVMFGLEVSGRSSSAEASGEARMWLELVGLSKFASAYPHQLSGGMKQRVAIARALANRPRMLLMDEPFGALDAQTRETLQGELTTIHARTQKTILFVTHDLDEAVLLADRVVVMQLGRVHEMMDVPLPRPRRDIEAVRGSAAFAETRYRLWRAINAQAH